MESVVRSTLKKKAVVGVRIVLCVAAAWAIGRSVALDDTLTLADSGRTLSGRVVDLGKGYRVEREGGHSHTVPQSGVAGDAQGRPLVTLGLRSIWRASDKALLVAALAAFLAVPLLQGARLQRLLAAHGVRMGTLESARLAFIGNFLNFAAPFGSTAGDVYKAWYATRGTDRKTEAAVVVLLDRVLGLVVLLLSVGVVALFAGAESRLAILRPYILTLIAIALVAGALWCLPPIRKPAVIRRLAAGVPHRAQLARIDQAARAMLTHWRSLLQAALITLLLQGFAALAFVFVGTALGLRLGEVSPLSVYAWFSAGEIVKALPGPPQGLGTMELAYGFFFAGLGSTSQIVGAALGIRLVNLACALPGALLLAGGQRPAQVRPRPVTELEPYPSAASGARG